MSEAGEPANPFVKAGEKRGTKSFAKAGDWKRTDADTPSRGKLIALYLFMLLGLAGVIIGMVLFWPKAAARPIFVSLPISQYKDPWPVNPWADRDAELLTQTISQIGDDTIAFKSFEFQKGSRLKLLLDWLSGQTSSSAIGVNYDLTERPLIVHVAAFAIVRDGTLYLLPGNAQPTLPESWNKVETLARAGKPEPTADWLAAWEAYYAASLSAKEKPDAVARKAWLSVATTDIEQAMERRCCNRRSPHCKSSSMGNHSKRCSKRRRTRHAICSHSSIGSPGPRFQPSNADRFSKESVPSS